MRALRFTLILATLSGCGKPADATQGAPKPTETVPSARAADDKASEVEQAKGAAKVEVANAKAAIETAAAKVHDGVHAKVQVAFDEADRKFTALKVQAGKATGAAKQAADTAAADITAREATVMASLTKLRAATGADWDAAKVQLDADTAALDKAVDAFAASLK